MYLKHGDLLIRDAEASDGAILAAWWNDGRVMAHAGFPNGLGTTAEEVAGKLSCPPDVEGGTLIIEKAGEAIGEMSYRSAGGGKVEIGIKICDFSKQEKGYGRILLSIFIEELFRIGYEKIVLDTNLTNLRAQHVYESLGFTRLRVNKDSWEDQLGQKQSSVDYEQPKGQLKSFA